MLLRNEFFSDLECFRMMNIIIRDLNLPGERLEKYTAVSHYSTS